MNYLKRLFQDASGKLISWFSTDDNVLCENNKYLRENLNNIDTELKSFQKKTDKSLGTKNKEIVGAINEVNAQYKDIAKQVDAQFQTVGQDLDKKTKYLNSLEINVKYPPIPLIAAKGDGVTDDTTAIQLILDYTDNSTIFFPDGNYLISDTIRIEKGNCLKLNHNARIFTNSKLDVMISYNGLKTGLAIEDLSKKKFIRGGKIDGNNLATNIIELSFYMGFTLYDVQIYNFLGYGLKTRGVEGASAELIASNLYFRNTQFNPGAIAIYNNGRDNQFNDIIIMDVETAVWSGDGFWSKIHHWIYNQAVLPLSCTFWVTDGFNTFNQCYSDTVRYPFKATDTAYIVRASDCFIFYNKDVYTTDLATTYPITLFTGNSNVKYYVNNCLMSLKTNCTMCTTLHDDSRFIDNVIAKSSPDIVVSNSLDHNVSNQLKLKASMISNDANKAVVNGSYTTTTSWTNLPYAEYGVLSVMSSLDWCIQVWKQKYTPYMFVRVGNSTSWDNWYRLGTQSGTTENRPTKVVLNGTPYYDTTLGKPIWYNAGVWKDATGTNV